MWHYTLDAEGQLWHEGGEIDDPAVLKLFMEKMQQAAPDSSYRVFCQGEECQITVEDVPYVIQSFEKKPDHIELIFPGDYRETLDPTTLAVGKLNVLYCRIKNGKFLARFNRKSYWEFAKLIQFDPKAKVFYFPFNEKKYQIRSALS